MLAASFQHLLAGLLKCGECGASFTVSNARMYQCASYVNGGTLASSNSVSVKRELVQARILHRVRTDLADPAIFAEVELCFRQAIKSRKPQVIDPKRIAERGLCGSKDNPEQPTFSPANSTRSQCWPPSVVRNTPRSCWGPVTRRKTQANTMSGFDG